ncbi:MAG: phosphate ABC transporter permease PstA [Planctomycetota bacterium]|nr:phosphate ABC transporter permease PstA [Planctomycetota bacterium]
MSWRENASSNMARRHLLSNLFRLFCGALTWLGIVLLVILLAQIIWQGGSRISWDFLTRFSSSKAAKAGIYHALTGTIWLIAMTAAFAIPVGVAAAVYLEEYSKKGRLSTLIEINISNLAGVPSIVYGLLGVAVFKYFFNFGQSLLTGSLTMSLLILPVIITAAREALKAVPSSLRQAAFGLGATRWQVVRYHVLPAAVPGILTGIILSLSRAIGESAPLLVVGAATSLNFTPSNAMDEYSALPIQIYHWAGDSRLEFRELAASGIIVLLAVLLLMNATAIIIRWKSEAKTS